MQHYYYSVNDEQLGPFTFEELKKIKIKKTTLVWTDGMDDWMPASSIPELSEIVISEPPPLPKKTESNKTSTSDNILQNTNLNISQFPGQYDESYQRTYGEVVFGALIIITPIVLADQV